MRTTDHLWLEKHGHRHEVFVRQGDRTAHVGVSLLERVRQGLDHDAGLDEVVQRQGTSAKVVKLVQHCLDKPRRHVEAHLLVR